MTFNAYTMTIDNNDLKIADNSVEELHFNLTSYKIEVYFSGAVTDFNMWASPLTPKQMLSFTRDCMGVFGDNKMVSNVIDWNKMEIVDKSSSVVIAHSSSVSCDWPIVTVVLPRAQSFDDAFLSCRQLGGKFP